MRAGDVVHVDFGIPAGSEPGFFRPAVVVTADLVLEARPRTIHVMPLTGNTVRQLPTELEVSADGLDRPTAAQAHLCTVISADRVIAEDLGNIGAESLGELRGLLGDLLDLPR